MKFCFKAALLFSLLVSSAALCEVKRLQVCASSCETSFCKKVAEEVEFEFELSKDFLLPVCQKKLATLPKKEFRLLISQEKNPSRIVVELDCQGANKCLSKEYPPNLKGQALTNKVVSDVRLAIKHNKAIETIHKNLEAVKSAPVPVVTTAPPARALTMSEPLSPESQSPPSNPAVTPNTPNREEEWDRVVLVQPTLNTRTSALEGEDNLEASVAKKEPKSTLRQPLLSIAMTFGGENWNYNFESDSDAQNNHPFHSRVYPKMLLATSYWALPYVRLSSNLSAAVSGFRLKTNQPVEGDGQLVIGQLYQADFLVSAVMPLWQVVHIGIDTGYEFSGAFVDSQRIAERQLTVIPSYQSHGFRIGPRIIVGALTDKGLIDLGIGFYPYMHYFEAPDEPTSSRTSFAWSAEGGIRLMLSSEIFAEARIRTTTIHVHYEQDAMREGIDGEKWGAGRVRNLSAFATAGIGWSF